MAENERRRFITGSLWDVLRVAPHYALPHHLLSGLMRIATRVRAPSWKDRQIRWFVKRYGVDMTLARYPETGTYEHFNAFFTRELREGARAVCAGEDQVACPADGVLSEFGPVRDDTLVQAKGKDFSLTRLLGGSSQRAAAFRNGHFATVYLSPRDYHRVHMPLSGILREMVHVPGRLFSVNPSSARVIPDLFARNERVVSVFDTSRGPLAVVLVGAVFVGNIEQVWCGQVAPAPGGGARTTDYPASGPTAVRLDKGQEMGRFNMGSTVVVVLPPDCELRWPGDLRPGCTVSMGQVLAELRSPSGV
jgi:phosphatidylserine decarboxylase